MEALGDVIVQEVLDGLAAMDRRVVLDHQALAAGEWHCQAGRPPAWRPGRDGQRQQIELGLICPDDGMSFVGRFFRTLASIALLLSGVLLWGYSIAQGWPLWYIFIGFLIVDIGAVFTPLAMLS